VARLQPCCDLGADAFGPVVAGDHRATEHEGWHAAYVPSDVRCDSKGHFFHLGIARINPQPDDIQPWQRLLKIVDERQCSLAVGAGTRVDEVKVDDRCTIVVRVMPDVVFGGGATHHKNHRCDGHE